MYEFLGTTSHTNGEMQYYTDSSTFLKALQTHLRGNDASDFAYNIVFADAQTLKALDDLIYKLHGEINPNNVDHYRKRAKCNMTNEEKNEALNTALYEKAFAEQEDYRAWLLSQTPEEILHHAYDYSIREDILMSFEINDLEDAQAVALLGSRSPLYEVFHDFDRQETDHMDNILDCIKERADTLIKRQAEKKQALREKLPELHAEKKTPTKKHKEPER